jgi:hypothetical protein
VAAPRSTTFALAPSPLRPKTFTLGQSAGRRETENVYGRMTVDHRHHGDADVLGDVLHADRHKRLARELTACESGAIVPGQTVNWRYRKARTRPGTTE